MDEYQLMIPGPIQLAPEVLSEMGRQIVPHYGREWTSFYNGTLELLRQIFQTTGDVYIIPGSGSAGLDAAIGSVLGETDKLLVLSNGFFGERMASIGKSYKTNTTVLQTPVTQPFMPSQLADTLDKDREITAVAACHSESSSGLLNPIQDLAAVCQEREVLLIVDAVSSLGGINLKMDEWGIGICVSASQKCLEGPPGLGLVAVSKHAWKTIEPKETRGWYLNLHVWKQFSKDWADWHPYPVTMAVPAVRALRRGIELVLNEGLETRFNRHKEMSKLLRSKLSELGFLPVFPSDIASPTVIAFNRRSDLSAEEVVVYLEEEHKIKIAHGMGVFKEKAFRIGNMGPQATQDHIIRLSHAIEELVDKRVGIPKGDNP